MQGTTQHDAFAMQFDLPHAAVGARIVRVEADGRERGSSRKRARPRIEPACSV